MQFNILFQVENQSDVQFLLDLAERLGIKATAETPEEIEEKAFKKRLAARKRFVKFIEESRKQMTEFATEAEIDEVVEEIRTKRYEEQQRQLASNH